MENEERLIQLETKISYLENDLQELNAIVIEQAKLLAKLSADAEEFRRMSAQGEIVTAHEKPPHY
jgi:uncharacterized coiled-coil protein SlyX